MEPTPSAQSAQPQQQTGPPAAPTHGVPVPVQRQPGARSDDATPKVYSANAPAGRAAVPVATVPPTQPAFEPALADDDHAQWVQALRAPRQYVDSWATAPAAAASLEPEPADQGPWGHDATGTGPGDAKVVSLGSRRTSPPDDVDDRDIPASAAPVEPPPDLRTWQPAPERSRAENARRGALSAFPRYGVTPTSANPPAQPPAPVRHTGPEVVRWGQDRTGGVGYAPPAADRPDHPRDQPVASPDQPADDPAGRAADVADPRLAPQLPTPRDTGHGDHDGYAVSRLDTLQRDPTQDQGAHHPAQHDPAPHDPAQHDPAQHDPARHEQGGQRLGQRQEVAEPELTDQELTDQELADRETDELGPQQLDRGRYAGTPDHSARYEADRHEAAPYETDQHEAAPYETDQHEAAQHEAAQYPAAQYEPIQYGSAATYGSGRYGSDRQRLDRHDPDEPDRHGPGPDEPERHDGERHDGAGYQADGFAGGSHDQAVAGSARYEAPGWVAPSGYPETGSAYPENGSAPTDADPRFYPSGLIDAYEARTAGVEQHQSEAGQPHDDVFGHPVEHGQPAHPDTQEAEPMQSAVAPHETPAEHTTGQHTGADDPAAGHDATGPAVDTAPGGDDSAAAEQRGDDRAPDEGDTDPAGSDASTPAPTPLRPGDVQQSTLAVWSEPSAQRFRDDWHEVKALFVDEPVEALAQAGALVTAAVNEVTAALLSEQERLDPLRDSTAPDTETMRIAMRRYREFLDRILEL